VIYRALRDLARDVEKNEKYKNDDHMGAEAATAHSSACNAEITKSDFKNPSKTFFSQETNFLRATQHASAILLRGVFLLRTTSKCERASEVLRIPRDARATVST